MAVLALGLAGSAIGGGIGSALGLSVGGVAVAASLGQTVLGAVGSYVDSTIIFPALFGRDNPQTTGPKIGDLQLTTAAAGSPVYYVLGRNNRVPGMIIWMSKVKKVKEETDEGGGKMGGSTTVVTYKFYVSIAIALCEGPVSALRKVWANGKVIYDNTGSKEKTYNFYKSITFYPGNTTQLPDPTIEGFDGVGKVPGYRGTSYVVFERFTLHKFGDRMPNFNFLIEEQPQTLLSEAFDKIIERAGRPATDFDTTWLRGEELQGYTIAGPMSAQKQFEPLMTAFDVVAQEYGGIIHFRKRKDVGETAIDLSSLAAHEEGSDVSRKINVSPTAGFDLPKEVDVQFLNPEINNQKDSQREIMIHAVSDTVSSFDLPVVMTPDQARTLARRTLWSSWAERNQINLTLPPSLLTVLESDVLTFTDDHNNPWRVRVTKVTRGNNYLVQVEGVTEQLHTLTVTAIAGSQADVSGGPSEDETPPPTPTPTPNPTPTPTPTPTSAILAVNAADFDALPADTLITTWSDGSGQSNDLKADTDTARQPKVGRVVHPTPTPTDPDTGFVDGQSYVKFRQADKTYLQTDHVTRFNSSSQPFSVVMVCRHPAGQSPDADLQVHWGLNYLDGGTPSYWSFDYQSNKPFAWRSGVAATPLTLPATKFFVLSWIENGVNQSKAWVNGTLGQTFTGGTDLNCLAGHGVKLILGTRLVGSFANEFANLDVAYMLVWDRVITDAERILAETQMFTLYPNIAP